MTTIEAYRTVHRMISTERKMREYVFRNQPMKIDAKLADCDNALAALETLRQAANVRTDSTPDYSQPGLL